MFQKIQGFLTSLKKPIQAERGGIVTTLLVIGIITLSVAIVAPTVASLAGPAIMDWLGDVGKGVLKALCWFFFYVSKFFVETAGDILKSVLTSNFLRYPITKAENSVVREGWKIVRNLANMFIVLGFVVVGIATILRVREYEAQKTLFPLILIAILINFSLVICGLIIDASNIIMDYFLQGAGGAGGIVTPITESLNSDADNRVQELVNRGDSAFWEMVGTIIGLTVFNVIATVVFATLGFLLIIRQAMLMCLAILAPLAFCCWIFNATKKLWSMWWESFVKWCFIGVGAIFFTYLAAYIISKGLFAADPAVGAGPAEAKLGALGFLVPIIFLLVGLKITRTSSAMGATATIGLATGAAGFIAGKALAGGKALGGRIKESRAGDRVGGAVGAVKEKLHLAPAGTTAQARSQRREESRKRLQNLSSEKLAQVAEGRTRSRKERAAATEILAERGDIDKISPARMESAVAHAAAYGVKRSDLEKVDPRIAAQNNTKVNEIMRRTGHTGGRAAAEQIAIKERVDSMSRKDWEKVSSSSLQDSRVVGAVKDKEQVKALIYNRSVSREKKQKNAEALLRYVNERRQPTSSTADQAEARRILQLVKDSKPTEVEV